MPKNIDYSTTEIYFYKLCCNDISVKDIYIGHTTNFTKRKACRKTNCIKTNKNYHYHVYKFIRNNGGWNNWSMVLLDRIKCHDKLDALKYERDLIERHNATLNKNIPSRTTREYYQIYRHTHKNQIKE